MFNRPMFEETTRPKWTREQIMRNTPSRADGISYELEAQRRRYYAKIIQESGILLKFPQATTIATATVYMHRFFMAHSMKPIDPILLASTCLYIAGKSQETIRKASDVINTTYKVVTEDRLRLGKEYTAFKDDVIENEQYFLRYLGFDLHVELPYKYLLNMTKFLNVPPHTVHTAWTLVNDSFRTTLCIEYPPYLIACACLYLAAKFTNDFTFEQDLQHYEHYWWENFGDAADMSTITQISVDMLQLYIEEDMRMPPSEREEVKSENHLANEQHLSNGTTVNNDTNNIKKEESGSNSNDSVNTISSNSVDVPKVAKPRINVTVKTLKQ